MAAVLATVACTYACASKAPPSCCAALGYTRAQVESAVGPPSPPQSSKYHPLPSPPPGTAIYTTEHGYLTITYSKQTPPVAKLLSLDFYEGKDPVTAFSVIKSFLPPDAVDANIKVVGAKYQERGFKSAQTARALPESHGLILVECASPNPARECDRMDVATKF